MKFIYRIKQLMLASGDLVLFCFAFWLALTLRHWQTPDLNLIESHLSLFITLFSFWLVINYINGLYHLPHLKHKESRWHFVESALASLFFSFILIYIFSKSEVKPKTILILTIALGYSFSAIWRQIFNLYINSKTLLSNVIFVGHTPEVDELTKILQRYPERGYKTVALVDPESKLKSVDFPFFDVYYGLKTLRPAISNYKAKLVVIAPHLKNEAGALRELYELLFWNVKIVDISSFYENITGRIPPSTFSEGWFLEHLQSSQPVYEKIKTMADFIIALCMGLVFIVLLPFIALLTKMDSPGPIFFKQKRIGQFGKLFYLYKFRSMYALEKDGSAETDGAQFAQKDDVRITTFGKFLGKTRLDELPQFINLFKKDISFIGPRPERPEIVEQLKGDVDYYPLRHIIKPGITGWAAVHQNYTDTIEKTIQKLQYDLYYIKNRSFLLDISILLKTINVIFRMRGQ